MRVGRTGSTDGRGVRRRTALGCAGGGQASSWAIAQHLFPVLEPARPGQNDLAKHSVPDLKLWCASFCHFVQSCKVKHCGTRTRRVDELGFKPTARTVFCPRNLPKLSVKLLRTLITQSYTSIQSFEQGPPRCSVLHGSLGAFDPALGGVSLLSIITQLTTICGRSSRGSLATYIGCTRLQFASSFQIDMAFKSMGLRNFVCLA